MEREPIRGGGSPATGFILVDGDEPTDGPTDDGADPTEDVEQLLRQHGDLPDEEPDGDGPGR